MSLNVLENVCFYVLPFWSYSKWHTHCHLSVNVDSDTTSAGIDESDGYYLLEFPHFCMLECS